LPGERFLIHFGLPAGSAAAVAPLLKSAQSGTENHATSDLPVDGIVDGIRGCLGAGDPKAIAYSFG
jgi:hypothetical protein